MLSDLGSWDTTPAANLIELWRILKPLQVEIDNGRTKTRVRRD